MSELNQTEATLLHLTADLLKAMINTGGVNVASIGPIANTIYAALRDAPGPIVPAEPAIDKPTKAQIATSITDDYLVCFEDGKKFKSLKRHLRVHYNLTPAEYRAKWGLPDDYPTTAPGYSARRSEMAKAIGLGKKVG